MVDSARRHDRFNWWLLLYAAMGATIIFLPLATYGFDVDELLYIFVVVPIVSLISLVIAIVIAFHKNRLLSLTIVSMLIVYCAVTWGLFRKSEELHTVARWLLSSEDYKAEILRQPAPASGEMKHVEWDGWGWGGNDTIAYLVFDPDDSLASAARSHAPGKWKFSGISCEVSRVIRLQSHWYSVVFYTDTGWGYCGLASEK